MTVSLQAHTKTYVSDRKQIKTLRNIYQVFFQQPITLANQKHKKTFKTNKIQDTQPVA
jgi:hypothetical protein